MDDVAPPVDRLPVAPRKLEETGLDPILISEIIAKIVYHQGKTQLTQIVSKIKLPAPIVSQLLDEMVIDRMLEVVKRGVNDAEVIYQLTDGGKQRAEEYMSRCRYTGAAPVTLDDYRQQVQRQSVRNNRVTQQDIRHAYAGITLNPEVMDCVGAAMNSGKPLFIYGPPGSGKTYIAEKLDRLMPGLVAIPHAIVVDGEIIQVFDPLLHLPVAPAEAGSSIERRRDDERWLLCRRPLVLTGGELSIEMLDLRYDARSGFYQAPPHFKANNGIFIVDDLGRQQSPPEQLMNRWIVPMDRQYDHLALHTGYKFTVPFDVTLVFSTNLAPEALADEAFLRRLGYKIYVGEMAEADYRDLVQQVCQRRQVPFDEAGFRYLVDNLHRPSARPLMACYPNDLLGQLVDYSRYYALDPLMQPDRLRQAWDTYFSTPGRRM
ncbi:YifB family Mg chelatase-like AAA ATPase [Methylobacillus flagellatus]|uniref:YifB family Mg chelatase-like AAA ATPase n=1 Tax=Methylobacillus flagellatus TaxID=405 RepID=UPI0010F852F4|nr:YifB family Mg chelatase-like AAA ATPase [Methylobacillus flagellatus]